MIIWFVDNMLSIHFGDDRTILLINLKRKSLRNGTQNMEIYISNKITILIWSAYNPRQNIWNKVKKSSETEQD